MLTDDDIVRAVRSIRYSAKRPRNQRREPSMNGLATAAGLSRKCLYQIARRGTMSPETRDKLRHGLPLGWPGFSYLLPDRVD